MPYCKVCHSAGKPEEVYKSHYVRQTPHPNSPLTCPTILNNVCKHCNKTGHFISTCPVLKRERKIEREAICLKRKRILEDKDEKVSVSRPDNNRFAGLYDSDDEDIIIPKLSSEPESFKTTIVAPVKQPTSRGLSWVALMDDSDSDEE